MAFTTHSRFERELEALRKELADATSSTSRPSTAMSTRSMPNVEPHPDSGRTSPTHTDEYYGAGGADTVSHSGTPSQNGSPIVHKTELDLDSLEGSLQSTLLALDNRDSGTSGMISTNDDHCDDDNKKNV